MNKETAKKIRDILDAYINGKQIQHYGLLPPVIQDAEMEDGWYDLEYINVKDIIDRPKYYRVKTEPLTTPFTNSEEFYKALTKHGGYIYCKCDFIGECFSPFHIRMDSIVIVRVDKKETVTYPISYDELCKDWRFIDNTPCGKEE